MNQRERVLYALNHKEPDRVPVDLGGTDSTGITGIAYKNLKSYLGINTGKIKVFDTMQQIVEVEEEVLQAIRGDVRSIMIQAKNWKPGELSDGSICEIPDKWNPQSRDDGYQVILNQQGEITMIKPSNSHFFEIAYFPLKDCLNINDLDRYMEDIVNFDLPEHSDMKFKEMGKIARNIRKRTDYLLVGGNFAAHILAACQFLRYFDVRFALAHGQKLSIIGPSGSGKSTLLRCINYLEEPTQGHIYLDGQLVGEKLEQGRYVRMSSKELAPQRAEIGMVFQNFYLWPHLTAREHVAIGPQRVRGLSKKQAFELADVMLEKVHMAHKLDEYTERLSGGQQQSSLL